MKLHTKTIVLILLLIISLICLLSYFFYTKYKFLIDYIDSRTDLKLEKFSTHYQLDSLNEFNKMKEQNYIDQLKNNIINNDSENYFSKISNLSDIEEEDEDNNSEHSDINYPIINNQISDDDDTSSEKEDTSSEKEDTSPEKEDTLSEKEDTLSEKEDTLSEKEDIQSEIEEDNTSEISIKEEITPELSYQFSDDLPNLDNIDDNIDNYIHDILEENKDFSIEVEKKKN